MKNIVFCITILIITVLAMMYSEFKDISNSVIRLHIVANSNSWEDQELKLKVRDYVIDKYSFDNTDLENCKANINNILPEINKDVVEFLRENGVNYSVNTKFNNYYFPTKHYGNISLPCGNYKALKIILGNGEGENWWCVMYPPLCFAENSRGVINENSEIILKKSLNNDEINMITKPDYRFKTVEVFNSLIHFFNE